MEWGKVKTLFIYLFLFLNTVLATYYIYTIQINKTEVYREKDAIATAIKNDNIIIEEPLVKKESLGYISASTKDFKMPSASGNYSYNLEYNNGIKYLVIEFNAPIVNVVEDKLYRETLDTFIKEKLDGDATYVFEKYNKEKQIISYRQTIDNLVIYDNANATLEFSVDDDGNVVKVVQKALADFRKDKTETIASYTQAIYKLYHDNYIPAKSKVTSSIGYYTYVSELNNQVLIPTWKIEITTLEETKHYYVDAINIKILDEKK